MVPVPSVRTVTSAPFASKVAWMGSPLLTCATCASRAGFAFASSTNGTSDEPSTRVPTQAPISDAEALQAAPS